MAYTLFAVLAPSALFAPEPAWIADSKVITLEQGISMVPVTDALYDAQVHQHTPDPTEDWAGFILPSAPLVRHLRQLSEHGVVAYVEADFFGGVGEQRCVVWRGGEIVLGPLDSQEAINKALSRLGAKRQLFHDEFEAVGLPRHRSNEDWIASTE